MTKNEIIALVNFVKSQKEISCEEKLVVLMPHIGYRTLLKAFEFKCNEQIDQFAQTQIAAQILLSLLRRA